MITLDENCGLSWELVALLEVAAEEAGYSSPESFMIDTAAKEAGRVLARNGDSDGTLYDKRAGTEEGFPQEEQLDLFGEQE